MAKEKQLVLFVHNIRSVYNVGSIFRVAAFFGVDEIIVSGYSPTPLHSKFEKTALGSGNVVHWVHKKTMAASVTYLKKRYPTAVMVGLENNLPASEQHKLQRTKDIAKQKVVGLLLGEEVSGISRSALKYCDYFFEIPGSGKKESLNVATATAIAVYEFKKR